MRNITLIFGTFKIRRYKSYVARSYHKRINLTNETYVGQLRNRMGISKYILVNFIVSVTRSKLTGESCESARVLLELCTSLQ